MHFSDTIKRAGVTGTSEGHKLLQDVAVHSLKQSAGYMPARLPDSVYLRQVQDSRPVTPSRSASQLYRMILGGFQFENCFPEWCLLVAQHGMRIPSELIPSLLDSDLIYRDWQDVALLAMGNYARWVVAHKNKALRWQWVKETPTPSIERIEADIETRSQNYVQNYEVTASHTNFFSSLNMYHYFWSEDLTRFFIRQLDYLLEHVPPEQWRYQLADVHKNFAYYAPLAYHGTYTSYLARMKERQITDFDMEPITEYRQKVHQIIKADAISLKGTG